MLPGAVWVSPECLLGASWVPPGCLLGVSLLPPGCLLEASWPYPASGLAIMGWGLFNKSIIPVGILYGGPLLNWFPGHVTTRHNIYSTPLGLYYRLPSDRPMPR